MSTTSGFGGTGKGWWAQNEQVTGAVADKPAHHLGDYGVARGNARYNLVGKGLGQAMAGSMARKHLAKKQGLGDAVSTDPPKTEVMPTIKQPQPVPTIQTAMPSGVSNVESLFAPKQVGASPTRFQTATMPATEALPSSKELAAPTQMMGRQASFDAGAWLSDVRTVPGDQSVEKFDPQARFNFGNPELPASMGALNAGPLGIDSQPALGFTPRRAAFSSGAGSGEPETAEVVEIPKSMGTMALNAGPKPRRKPGIQAPGLSRIRSGLAPFSQA